MMNAYSKVGARRKAKLKRKKAKVKNLAPLPFSFCLFTSFTGWSRAEAAP